MDASWSDAAKAKKLHRFFQKHGRIYIVVNAGGKGVRVPDDMMGDSALRLVLNVRMPQSIAFHDDALESELSFSGKVFPCHIPMHCIWASYVPEQGLDSGILWENDVPDNVRAVVSAVRKLQETDEQIAENTGDTAPLGSERETKAGVQPAEKRVRHLRVVK